MLTQAIQEAIGSIDTPGSALRSEAEATMASPTGSLGLLRVLYFTLGGLIDATDVDPEASFSIRDSDTNEEAVSGDLLTLLISTLALIRALERKDSENPDVNSADDDSVPSSSSVH